MEHSRPRWFDAWDAKARRGDKERSLAAREGVTASILQRPFRTPGAHDALR